MKMECGHNEIQDVQVMKTVFITMIFLLSVLGFNASVIAEPVSQHPMTTGEPLGKDDFSASLKGQVVTLGQRWDDVPDTKLGASLSDEFVGEVEFDGESYKFYHHQYDGFEIYTSNLWWDKADRDFDEYIVAQITFKSATLKTHRGAFIGMPITDINRLYGEGKHQKDNESEWVFYLYGKKRLSFAIVNDKVSAITLSFDN